MLLRACVKIRPDAAGHAMVFQVRGPTGAGPRQHVRPFLLCFRSKLNGYLFSQTPCLAPFFFSGGAGGDPQKRPVSASIEAVIIMPGSFGSICDVSPCSRPYQEYYTNQKAAYTIGDLISREGHCQWTPLLGRVFGILLELYDPLFRAGDRCGSPRQNMTKRNKRFFCTGPAPGQSGQSDPSRCDRLEQTASRASKWGNISPSPETWTSFSPPFKPSD